MGQHYPSQSASQQNPRFYQFQLKLLVNQPRLLPHQLLQSISRVHLGLIHQMCQNSQHPKSSTFECSSGGSKRVYLFFIFAKVRWSCHGFCPVSFLWFTQSVCVRLRMSNSVHHASIFFSMCRKCLKGYEGRFIFLLFNVLPIIYRQS